MSRLDPNTLKVGDEVTYGDLRIVTVKEIKARYVVTSDGKRWSLGDAGPYPRSERAPWHHVWLRLATDADRHKAVVQAAKRSIEVWYEAASEEQIMKVAAFIEELSEVKP